MSALKLAIPSKGRLKEQAEEFFANAGFRIEALGGSRGYFARIPNLPDVEVRLLSASEIASSVIAGDVHVGVSGEDLLREQAGDLDRVVHLLAPLGLRPRRSGRGRAQKLARRRNHGRCR
jgi:ATP phosphoribosyltransferase